MYFVALTQKYSKQGFIQDFQLGGGDDVPVINKSHLGGSGGMLPQKMFEF